LTYLTAADLADLIGCKPNQFARMRRWLVAGGWPFEQACGGCPRVLRAYHDERLRGQAQTVQAAALPANSPNFAALEGLRHGRKTPIHA
jgi:hypothetical protein